MSENTFFEVLPPSQLKTQIDTIEVAYQLISVTLIYGDIVIGCLAKHWSWDGQLISVGFNTSEGKRFGHSHYIPIDIKFIANIQVIPLSEKSIPKIDGGDSSLAFLKSLGLEDKNFSRLVVQDYPNPLATIICEHNLQIAEKYNLTVLGYVERALSTESIPSEGIELEEDYLLYADWDYFAQQIGGNVNIGASIPGVANISKNLNPSLQEEVLKRLKNSFSDRSFRKGTSSNVIKEHWLQGCIFVPESPESTYIEGEEYISVFCVSSGKNGETYPVLLKLKSLRYPLEFLGHITSSLNFYGELLPIPIQVLDKIYNKTLLIRAMGYFHS